MRRLRHPAWNGVTTGRKGVRTGVTTGRKGVKIGAMAATSPTLLALLALALLALALLALVTLIAQSSANASQTDISPACTGYDKPSMSRN